MKIVVTGGTGFIGSHLLDRLTHDRRDIVLLTRSAPRTERRNESLLRFVQWNPYSEGEWMKEIDGAEVIINLIGKSVVEERWNDRVKREILGSRIVPLQLIGRAVARARQKPSLLVSASAVGYYGDRNDEIITEESTEGGDFLAGVVRQWEEGAYHLEQYGVRVATPRIGLVLQKTGGMATRMLLPFRLFAGGPIGGGKQFLPWVHMEDVVRGILYPMENSSFRGPYNLVSPSPVTMSEFARRFGAALHRPSWFPVPPFVLTVMFGEGGKVILSGQRALPARLEQAGFRFSYSNLDAALNNILR